MRDFAFVTQPDGSVVRHVFIRTKEANQIMENINMKAPNMEQYTESQKSATIDNLTAQLGTLNNQIKSLEDQLTSRHEEREITKDILRGRLETTLTELAPQKPFVIEAIDPSPLDESILDNEVFDEDGHVAA